MSTVPEDRAGKIEFYAAHLGPWAAHAAAIGLSPGAVASIAHRLAEAREAYEAHRAAQAAARAATAAYHQKVAALHGAPGGGSDAIRTIRAFAETTGDPNVYTLAQIPPPAAPAAPGSGPPPGTPFDLRLRLHQDGALELRWRCSNPRHARGIVYEIMRSTGEPGAPSEYLGAVGTRRFVDRTLAAAAGAEIVYRITAVRSTSRGDPAEFIVRLGAGGPAPREPAPREEAAPAAAPRRAA